MTNLQHLSKKKKQLFATLLAAVLLIAAVEGVAVGVKSCNKDSDEQHAEIQVSAAHAIVKNSCSSALYQDLCYSTLASSPEATKKVRSIKDVIEISLNITITTVQHNYLAIKKLMTTRNGLTKRQKIALHDCLETTDDTLDDLHKAEEDLQEYPNKKSLQQHADDLKTFLSSAITNQETCLDGFSHDDADKHVREGLEKGVVHVENLCSNVLAMIKNITDTDIENEMKLIGLKLKEDDATGWPVWLSASDRRLLQAPSVMPNVTVAADGSGNFRTVSAAVAAAPNKSSSRYIIRIKAGVYGENVDVPKSKTNIMFVGDGRANTIITGCRNVKDNDTTFHSATVAAVGRGFLARDITFENTAGACRHQAVALRVGADFSAFYRCNMLAYQDTLYVHKCRQFYVECLIEGTVDFIFGNAAAVLQNCDIHARRPNPGQSNMVTAQSRSGHNQNTGIVIQKCRIGAASDLLPVQGSFRTYLGRPWMNCSRTVVMQSYITDVIDPAGWHRWNDSDFALDTLFYAEYQNTGAGADTSERVRWKGFRVLTSATEAEPFTAGRFIDGGRWLGSTGFPYSLGL